MTALSNTVRGIWLAVLAATVLAVSPNGAAAQGQRFQFAAVGDTGYSKKSEAEFTRMIAAMNKEPLAFVAHVGDFEADPRPYERSRETVSMPCVDASFRSVLAQFQESAHPLVLTPGDNDWADCHQLKAQKADPMERLAKVREMFYPDGRTLGKRTFAVNSQAKSAGHAKFRENLSWAINGVQFVTIHVVGSNDNKGRTPEMDAEAAERTAANIAWLKKAFADAKDANAPGLVIITQANPGFESMWTPSLKDRYIRVIPGATPPKETPATGYTELLNVLAAEMESYAKPTLFVHGDTHIFHVNKPLISKKTQRFFENFTRLEVFGDPESHWVRVTVDPAKPGLFTIEPEIIRENAAN